MFRKGTICSNVLDLTTLDVTMIDEPLYKYHYYHIIMKKLEICAPLGILTQLVQWPS